MTSLTTGARRDAVRRSPPRTTNYSVTPNGHLSFETAAEHATRSVPVVDVRETMQDVRATLIERPYECASHVVVCQSDKFRGVARIEDVLSAPAECRIDSIMDTGAPVVGPGIDQELAAWQAVRHQESALSVVGQDGRFIGIIPPDRIIGVLLSEHEEDLSRLGGFLKSVSTARTSSEETVERRFRHRLPWLLLGLAGSLAAADVVGWFEAELEVHVLLAFFIPGIVYLADAVGTQTETIVVRGLSLGVPMRRMMWRELMAGLVIGAALAVAAGPIVWWRWSDPSLAISLAVSIFAACSTATVAAMALPRLFDAFGVDPAFGSGPLATVVQDLLSIWIYLSVTTAVMA